MGLVCIVQDSDVLAIKPTFEYWKWLGLVSPAVDRPTLTIIINAPLRQGQGLERRDEISQR
jgi:hypothetical protein